MTTVLIKKATIQDKNSSFHNQTVDIKIESGIITEIANEIASPENATVVEKETYTFLKVGLIPRFLLVNQVTKTVKPLPTVYK